MNKKRSKLGWPRGKKKQNENHNVNKVSKRRIDQNRWKLGLQEKKGKKNNNINEVCKGRNVSKSITIRMKTKNGTKMTTMNEVLERCDQWKLGILTEKEGTKSPNEERTLKRKARIKID
jgi:hypothetical protein